MHVAWNSLSSVKYLPSHLDLFLPPLYPSSPEARLVMLVLRLEGKGLSLELTVQPNDCYKLYCYSSPFKLQQAENAFTTPR